jgi:hypothetical protein
MTASTATRRRGTGRLMKSLLVVAHHNLATPAPWRASTPCQARHDPAPGPRPWMMSSPATSGPSPTATAARSSPRP